MTATAKPPREQDDQLTSAFQRSVDDGVTRLRRTWPHLLATGLVGGIDLSLGVIGLLVVHHETGSPILGALAFTIGFIALSLGRSELFTENFLVPVTAVVARNGRIVDLLRLWGGTATTNLIGGWVVMGLVVAGLPRLAETAVEVGSFYPDLGLNWGSFALAVVGGAVITIMTWMERGARTEGGKLVAVVGASFLLAAAPLNHVIVSSLEMFAALHAGAPFGYLDYLGAVAWAALGNMVGGLVLVTLVRLVQVGREPIDAERRKPA